MLCGNNGEACWSKYGSYPLHRPYCHEMAVRILLACIDGHANRYKRHIVPLLSLSIDFYIRVSSVGQSTCRLPPPPIPPYARAALGTSH